MISLLGSLIVYLIAVGIGKGKPGVKVGVYFLLFFLAAAQTAMYAVDMFYRKVPTP